MGPLSPFLEATMKKERQRIDFYVPFDLYAQFRAMFPFKGEMTRFLQYATEEAVKTREGVVKTTVSQLVEKARRG
jgi:hypothetical protein